jgi:hypothetical protein
MVMSIQTTGLSKEEGRRGDRQATKFEDRQPIGEEFQQFDCVRTIEETAKILGLSTINLRVMLRNGEGPKATRLSKRRIGIRDSHRIAWLNAQTIEALPA